MKNSGIEKYLIVSLGSIGRRHLRNLRDLKPHAQIGVLRLHTAVGDMPPTGADFEFSSLESALAFNPMAAIVAGPASTHLAIVSALVTAGVAVLTEKPIADRMTGIVELLSAAETRAIPLLVGYNLRFLPSLQKCRQLILEGIIGNLRLVRAEVGQYLPDWRPQEPYHSGVSARKELGGGALLELSHEIDYLYWILGMPATVSARGGNFGKLNIDVEDAVELVLGYENPQLLVNIHLDFLQRSPVRTCKFIGQEGTLIWNGMTDSIEIFQVATRLWSNVETETQSDRNQMYLDELQHFLNGKQASDPIASDGLQGKDVLMIVEAAKASMESNSVVEMAKYEKC